MPERSNDRSSSILGAKPRGRETLKAVRLALAVLLTLDATVAWAQPQNDEQALLRENFQKSDRSGDGRLDREEFKALIDLNAKAGLGPAARVRRFGAYGVAFERGDRNKDGYLQIAELAALRNR